MKGFLLIFLFAILFSFVSCGGSTAADEEKAKIEAKYKAADEHASALSADAVKANNDFAARIFKAMAPAEAGKNMMISPLSISIALTMTLNGASGDNLTEMKDVLGFKALELATVNQQFMHLIASLESADKDMVLAIANSVWMELSFEPSVKAAFIQALADFFDAKPYALDFTDPKSADTINSWVSEKTAGKIEKIIDEIGADAVMYLINAIYFKAAWTTTFDKNLTYDGKFTISDGQQKTVSLMTYKKDQEFKFFSSGYGTANGYSAVRLPYGRDKFAFYGFIPESETIDDFIKRMADTGIDSFFSNLTVQEIPVVLPKFKFEYEKSLNDILKSLGMTKAFDTGGLLNIADDNGLYISDVKHKTFIEVNEEGTEAAAVTSVEVGDTAMANGFYGTKPFVFIIRDDRSGTILFMGKVEDPSL